MGERAERATRAQMMQRIDEVFRLLVDGVDSCDICQLMTEKYEVAEDTGRRYIQLARKQLDRLTKASKQEALSFVLENLTDVLKETRRDKNYTCALGALSQIAKIHGLEKAPQEQLPKALLDLSDEQLDSEWNEQEAVH